jgi:hypothetical protein
MKKNKSLLINSIFAIAAVLMNLFLTDCPGNVENTSIDVSVSRLVFSHGSGLYDKPFKLVLKAQDGYQIYYSIDGSIPLPEKAGGGRVFKYNSPIEVKNRNGQPNLLATQENVSKMYGRTNDPRGFMPEPYYPRADQVPKATVIRAIAVDTGGKQSSVVTKTYFIGDNLKNYGKNPVISLVTDPYNLIDENYGIYVRGPADRLWPDYNFCMKGREWEREAHLEFFNEGRNVTLSTGAGIRIRGGWSRDKGQRSFNVYFREEYGINNLKNYILIPGAVQSNGKPIAVYKGFMLRNGGNDTDYTKFYDVFLQDLLSDRNFTTQAAVPCVVYLNGEYWGPYNLQEKYSDNHTEYKYGVKKDNVISYDNGELDDGTAADEALYVQMIDMRKNDMSVKANYGAFCDIVDIQSYIDYYAAEIYIYNEDWPYNNYRVWRVRTPEPGNPYGDCKWRWQMFDVEFALGIYSEGRLTGQSGKNAFDKILTGTDMNHRNNQLFRALLANNDFCRQFVITMMDLYNINFHPNFYSAKLSNAADLYKPLMNGYFERFGRPWSSVFDNKVSDAGKYLNDIRNAMTNNYLPAYFGHLGVSAGKLSNVTLSAKCNGANISGAVIKLNTVTPNIVSGSWTGRYYSTYPVTVTANVPGGYVFSHWTVSGGAAVNASAQTTAVNFTGNVTITANFIISP